MPNPISRPIQPFVFSWNVYLPHTLVQVNGRQDAYENSLSKVLEFIFCFHLWNIKLRFPLPNLLSNPSKWSKLYNDHGWWWGVVQKSDLTLLLLLEVYLKSRRGYNGKWSTCVIRNYQISHNSHFLCIFEPYFNHILTIYISYSSWYIWRMHVYRPQHLSLIKVSTQTSVHQDKCPTIKCPP